MSKPRKRRNKPRPSTPKAEKTTKQSALSSLYAIFLSLATLLGGVAAIAFFFPRVVVSPPSSPFGTDLSVSFDITNTGFIPLADVQPYIAVGEVIGPTHNGVHGAPHFGTRFTRPEWERSALKMDERFTVSLSDVIGAQAASADLIVGVRYRPWFLPITRERRFRFILQSGPGASNPHWLSVPEKP